MVLGVGIAGVLQLFSHWRTQVVLTEEQGVFLDMRKATIAQIDCEKTVRANLAACDTQGGAFVNPRDDQCELSNWFQPNQIVAFAGQSYKLKARCQKRNGGVYTLDVMKVAVDPDHPERFLPTKYARLRGQNAGWDGLTEMPIMCRPGGGKCLEVPNGGGSPASFKQGSLYKNQFFHRSLAVDPGNTRDDPAGPVYNLTPYAVSPANELSTSSFKITQAAFQGLIATEFEFFTFAHQFGYGGDRITASVKTNSLQISDTSNVNPYSAYSYISVKNFRIDGGKVFGDIDIFSFNYDPAGSGALYSKIRSLGVAIQDGTGIIGPASQATTAKISRTNVDLDGFEATIGIDATSYDSVQYRAIRASVFSSEPITPDICH